MTDADRLELMPALGITGTVSVPGDKSISHRLAMIGAIAEGTTIIHHFADSADCQSTLDCLRELGANRSVMDRNRNGQGRVGRPAKAIAC
jgi:3-phosphoshikimate 1-carboxyvinyltransferase